MAWRHPPREWSLTSAPAKKMEFSDALLGEWAWDPACRADPGKPNPAPIHSVAGAMNLPKIAGNSAPAFPV